MTTKPKARPKKLQQIAKFVETYIATDFDGVAAATAAGHSGGTKSLAAIASRYLTQASVQQELAKVRAGVQARTGIDITWKQQVLRRLIERFSEPVETVRITKLYDRKTGEELGTCSHEILVEHKPEVVERALILMSRLDGDLVADSKPREKEGGGFEDFVRTLHK